MFMAAKKQTKEKYLLGLFWQLI